VIEKLYYNKEQETYCRFRHDVKVSKLFFILIYIQDNNIWKKNINETSKIKKPNKTIFKLLS
jgi:hypothetical protein